MHNFSQFFVQYCAVIFPISVSNYCLIFYQYHGTQKAFFFACFGSGLLLYYIHCGLCLFIEQKQGDYELALNYIQK